jgi:hypothetical protein
MQNFVKIERHDLPRKVEFWQDGDTLKMIMSHSCTTANMQDNNAAFEAWALVLKSEGYGRIVLSESESPESPTLTMKQHYNRFLFRALCFEKAFEWFALSEPLKKKIDRLIKKILSNNNLFVNAPLCLPQENSERSEATVERLLIRNENREYLNRKLCIQVGRYYQQLPVGLFINRVITEGAVFPSDQSAIDIWGLSESSLHFIELKVGNNKDLGVLSQVFFYACFISEMYCRRRLEKKDPVDLHKYKKDGSFPRGYKELVNAKIESVVAHILTERKHPKLDAAFSELQRCKLNGIRFANAECYSRSEILESCDSPTEKQVQSRVPNLMEKTAPTNRKSKGTNLDKFYEWAKGKELNSVVMSLYTALFSFTDEHGFTTNFPNGFSINTHNGFPLIWDYDGPRKGTRTIRIQLKRLCNKLDKNGLSSRKINDEFKNIICTWHITDKSTTKEMEQLISVIKRIDTRLPEVLQ